MKRLPEYSGYAEPRECGARKSHDHNVCGVEASVHIAWAINAAGRIRDTSFVCGKHWPGIRDHALYWRAHNVGDHCGMPRAKWDRDTNTCRLPDGLPVWTGAKGALCAAR